MTSQNVDGREKGTELIIELISYSMELVFSSRKLIVSNFFVANYFVHNDIDTFDQIIHQYHENKTYTIVIYHSEYLFIYFSTSLNVRNNTV